MNPGGFPFFRENWKKQTNFPGDVVLANASFRKNPPVKSPISNGSSSWPYHGRKVDSQNELRADVSQKQKALKSTTYSIVIQLVYIMIMILQCSTLGRFAKYYS